MHFHLLCISLSHFICLCNDGSGEEIPRVPGQSPSFRSETGATHPNGPPSQPYALHRSQVTHSNHLRLWRVRINMYGICFHPICCHSSGGHYHYFFSSDNLFTVIFKCQVKAVNVFIIVFKKPPYIARRLALGYRQIQAALFIETN